MLARNLLMAFTLMVVSAVPALAADETWFQVRSPHFVVVSDGSEKQAREVAVGFEQIHDLFGVVLPGLRTDSGAQTIVFAPKSEKSMKALLFFESVPETLGGFFLHGKETNYAVIRLDAEEREHAGLYHEYIHELVALNFMRMPRWLNEGLAEYYSNSKFEKNRTIVGAPSERVALLQTRSLIPIQTLIKTTPNLNDEKQALMYYAECWALTHFLMSTDAMQNGRLMNTYLHLLQQGDDGFKAFQQTFGDPSELQQKFDNYVHSVTFRAMELNKGVDVDDKSFASKRMSPAETNATVGDFYIRMRQPDAATEKLRAAVTEDPKLAVAHENLALLNFWQGRDAEALTEFDQALSLDPNLYLALYYRTMMDFAGKTDTESSLKTEAALRKVLQLNSLYAPAWVELSKIYVRRGDLPSALKAAAQASTLEPDRSGYRTDVAAILLRQKNYADAITLAGRVASLWFGSDRSEALAVVNEARRLGNISPTADEQSQEIEEMKYSEGTSSAEGVVKSIVCEKSKPLALVLQSGGKDLSFQSAKNFSFGFSDTLWFAGDYFSTCYHLTGVNAVVRYKAPANIKPDDSNRSLDSTSATEFQYVEIRDEEIPKSSSIAAPAK